MKHQRFLFLLLPFLSISCTTISNDSYSTDTRIKQLIITTYDMGSYQFDYSYKNDLLKRIQINYKYKDEISTTSREITYNNNKINSIHFININNTALLYNLRIENSKIRYNRSYGYFNTEKTEDSIENEIKDFDFREEIFQKNKEIVDLKLTNSINADITNMIDSLLFLPYFEYSIEKKNNQLIKTYYKDQMKIAYLEIESNNNKTNYTIFKYNEGIPYVYYSIQKIVEPKNSNYRLIVE